MAKKRMYMIFLSDNETLNISKDYVSCVYCPSCNAARSIIIQTLIDNRKRFNIAAKQLSGMSNLRFHLKDFVKICHLPSKNQHHIMQRSYSSKVSKENNRNGSNFVV